MSKLQEKHTGRHPAVVEALRWLDSEHLPEHLATVARVFETAADGLLGVVSDGPQLTRAIHKLVAAKDCAVRQAVLDREKQG